MGSLTKPFTLSVLDSEGFSELVVELDSGLGFLGLDFELGFSLLDFDELGSLDLDELDLRPLDSDLRPLDSDSRPLDSDLRPLDSDLRPLSPL